MSDAEPRSMVAAGDGLAPGPSGITATSAAARVDGAAAGAGEDRVRCDGPGAVSKNVTGGSRRAAASDVSVIICAHTDDRRADLRAAVASVQAQLEGPLETIVVIDHNPGLARWARSELAATVIDNEGAPGASGARNAGAAQATGEILVFLDDDAIASPWWLPALVAPLGEDGVVGVGGTVEPVWEERRPAWFPDAFLWAVGASYPGQVGDGRRGGPVRNVWSCNMAIRRHVFERIGGFRDGFGKVGSTSAPEDTELCVRASQRFGGAHWHLAPEAVVSHRVPRGRSHAAFFMRRCFQEGTGKAAMADLTGRDTLDAERSFLAGALPRRLASELAGLIHGDATALSRAGAMVAGVLAAGTGYGLTRWLGNRRPGASPDTRGWGTG